ncbi:lipopolysaccharide biosynthesis protein [Enteroscipio rubneri]|uniref:lipopolysaccharide biosynthesis protein n=1 Tax=Enteroscipio rubneri TaxID=2070686 RepID=UPI003AF0ACFF
MASDNRSNSKNLLKNTGIFAVGTFGSKVLSLLIIPLCTHYIDTENMGVYDMSYTVVQLLMPIAMLSVAEALFRWLLDEAIDKKKILSTWAALFSTFMLVFTVAYWSAWAFLRFDDAPLMYLLVVTGCAYGSVQYGTRGLRNNKLFAASGIFYAVVYCALTFYLVVILRVGYRGLLEAILIATVGTTALLVALQPDLRQASRKLFDRSLAKEMTRYSVFLLPNQLCWWAISWLGRLIVVGFLGYAANGIFSVAMKFPSALSMVSAVFFPAWQEQAISLFGKDGSEEYFSSVFRRYARIFLSLLLPGVPFTILFVRIFMDSSYAQAADLVALLYLGASFSAFSSFFGVLYLCARDTKGAASTTVIGAMVNAAASLVLVPTAGIIGAAAANMLGNLLMWLVRTRQTRRYATISVAWGEVVLLSVVGLATGVLCGALVENWQLLTATFVGVVMMLAVNRTSIGWILGLLKGRNGKA